LVNTTSTLDLGSPALAVITSVTPTATTPIIGTLTGAQNKGNQDFCTAALFYIFQEPIRSPGPGPHPCPGCSRPIADATAGSGCLGPDRGGAPIG
jgi:hypothetical protein